MGTDETTYLKKVGDAITQESVSVFLIASVGLTRVIATQLAPSEDTSEDLEFISFVQRSMFMMGSDRHMGAACRMSFVTLKKALDAHKVISETSQQVLSSMKAEGVGRNLNLKLRQAAGAEPKEKTEELEKEL